MEQCAYDDWRAPLLPGTRPGGEGPLPPMPPGAVITRPPSGGGPLASTSPSVLRPPVVALGKFDALHRGHAALVTGAAALGGSPWLVSFSGMAEVLGWPPRAPLVAPTDRGRVLAGWGEGLLLKGSAPAPRERTIPFAAVRSLSPEGFVAALAADLGAAGVVVGQGYRFGHRAAGDTAALAALGSAAGLTVVVLPLVPQEEGEGQAAPAAVSSSAVRAALAAGDTAAVAALLGRRHRVVGRVPGTALAKAAAAGSPPIPLLLPAGGLANEAPGVGVYGGVAVAVGSGGEGGGVAAAPLIPVGAATVEVLPGGRGLEVVLEAGEWPPAAVGAAGTASVALDF